MRTRLNHTAIIIILTLLGLLFCTSCMVNKKQGYSPKLTNQQKTVCELIIKMFIPPHVAEPIDYERTYPIPYFSTDEFVKIHGSEWLKSAVEEYNEEVEYEPADDPREYLFSYYTDNSLFYDALVCIVVEDDNNYTFFSFADGVLISRRIKAHIEDDIVIIDNVDVSDEFIGPGSWNEPNYWIIGGWQSSDDLPQLYAFDSDHCMIVDFSMDKPIIITSPYEIKGEGVSIELNNGTTVSFKKTSEKTMNQVGDRTLLTKILDKPLIISKN